MDLGNTYESSQKDLNLGDVLQGEAVVKGSQNLQAITLYTYASSFLVCRKFKVIYLKA